MSYKTPKRVVFQHILSYTKRVMNDEILGLEWDDDNLRHILVESPHGLTRLLVETVKDTAPLLFINEPREGRSGTHVMIGPDADGRFWTVILLDRGLGIWRAITGWPSTKSEMSLYGRRD